MLLHPAGGLCPKGFGSEAFFPPEWQIPMWPQNMDPEQAGRLWTVTLSGFKIETLNEEYLEGPTEEFKMQGKETYWQASGQYFMYWCERYRKWRIASIDAFGNNKNGNCFGYVSDAYPNRDIRDTSLIKGWIEVDNGEWVLREDAGVSRLGQLADQMEAAHIEPDDPTCQAEMEDDVAGDEALPFTEKKRTSRCPMRRVATKVSEGLVAAGKWIRRLFPKLLGAPPEEDLQPGEH